ncbi:hypothetical protein R3W88_014399 [Solanum pinnatisectum]|uniref:F-box associated beta-propeller type 1 domain-containing protein n=1 Tax=Solanum pinnatisectum TaxID=50273 RepID=A0AAV9KRY5_9SOLN|nr:hypothetical protein R3W88_014399 [Solanum pinnatisectum]
MFSFLAFRDWIHQTFLFKFLLLWYHFIFTINHDSILPNEKCMFVSKSWHQLISSPHLVNTHLKLNGNHRVVFPGTTSHRSTTLSSFFMGSANGLIFNCNHEREMCIWNPTITLFIDQYHDFNNSEVYSMRIIVDIYSLRNDSWKTLYDQLQGIFLINHSGKFVNGMLYWIASTGIDDDDDAHNIICFDVANEAWGSLEIPIRGEDHSNIKLGVVGSDLDVLYICHICATTSDVWILKDCRGNMLWTKRFTIEYPKYVVLYMFSSPKFHISIHLQHIVAIKGYNPAKTYAESIVNPLTISGKNSA